MLTLENLRMDSGNEHLLVVRAIEDPDPSLSGKRLFAAPEEVVVQLLGGGLLERDDVAALWVDTGHDVLDRAVLAPRVERLEHDEQRVGVGRVEKFLGRGELFLELLEILLCEVLRAGRVLRMQPAGLGHTRAPGLEARLFAWRNHEILDDVLVQLHVRASLLIFG